MANSRKILLIDDNEEILVTLGNFLSKHGYRVTSAINGLEGLRLAETEGDGFDLVITDLVMPNISGVAVTSIVKKKNPRLPVIAITGYGEQPGALAREVNADAVFEKPFQPGNLLAKIKELLDEK